MSLPVRFWQLVGGSSGVGGDIGASAVDMFDAEVKWMAFVAGVIYRSMQMVDKKMKDGIMLFFFIMMALFGL